jgi:SAM-dependent methyltransferase
MDFRIKCAIQQGLSWVPGGRRLNYYLQRYASGAFPKSADRLENGRRNAERHVDNYQRIFGRKPRTIFEFGSGWDLCIAINMALTGAKVIASDIAPNATEPLIKDMLARCRAQGALQDVGVTYLAPCDARDTALPGGSIDLVTSTDVLEHIPRGDLPLVLAECRRLLSAEGICSFAIDYKDHWSRFDRRLPRLHFLRYSERVWPLFNPPLHFQNRLLHSDYLRLFKDAGFDVIMADVWSGEKPPRVAACFTHYSEKDLSTYACWFTLRPP